MCPSPRSTLNGWVRLIGLSREGSPWADLDYELTDREAVRWTFTELATPDVDLLHVYGDGANAVMTDINSEDSHDWRFGLNIAETWQENREALGVWDYASDHH